MLVIQNCHSKKTAAVVALHDFKSEDQRKLAILISAVQANLYRSCVCIHIIIVIIRYSSDKYKEQHYQWGGCSPLRTFCHGCGSKEWTHSLVIVMP